MKSRHIDFKLYLITDRKLITHYTSLITAVEEALKGGVRAIQLREKDLGTRELLKLAYKMRDLTGQYNARLFINDRFDIALAVSAEGVHLPQNSIPVDAVKRVVKNKLLIGVSTHSLKEAEDAEKKGADFITFGPVYVTSSKLPYGEPIGVKALTDVCVEVNIPIYAIGGIKTDNIKELSQTGVSGVAMISEVFNSKNIQKTTEEIITKVRESMGEGVRKQ
jgi:thiamine-phosphate pyrophosphorylase